MGIFQDITDWIELQFGYILAGIYEVFDTAFGYMTDFVDGLTSTLTNTFNTALNFLNNTIQSVLDLIDGIYKWLEDQAKGFTEFVTETFDAVVNELGIIYNDITAWLNDLTGQMTDFLIDIGKEVKGYFDMGYELLMSFFQDQWAQIEDFMTLIKDSIVSGFDATLEWITEKVTGAFDMVIAAFESSESWANSIFESVKGFVGYIAEEFDISLDDIVNTVIEFLEEFWDNITTYLEGLTDVTQDQIESFVESTMTAQMNIMKKLAAGV